MTIIEVSSDIVAASIIMLTVELEENYHDDEKYKKKLNSLPLAMFAKKYVPHTSIDDVVTQALAFLKEKFIYKNKLVIDIDKLMSLCDALQNYELIYIELRKEKFIMYLN